MTIALLFSLVDQTDVAFAVTVTVNVAFAVNVDVDVAYALRLKKLKDLIRLRTTGSPGPIQLN